MRTTGEPIHIQLLGQVRAWRGDEEVVLGPPKQRAVLGLLASRANDVVRLEHIIDAVWGSDVPQTAANGVHTYVAGLRRALEPGRGRRGINSLLASASGGYCLTLDPDAVDVTLFARRHAQARRARAEAEAERALGLYEDALGLWHGAAYSGVPGPFAVTERARLQDLRLTAVEEWAWDMLEIGRHAEAVTDLSAAVTEEPLREKLRWLLMLALYRCDRQAHALTVYTETRRLLQRELGIEPGAELRNLHQQILNGRPPVSPVAQAPVQAALSDTGAVPLAETPRPAQLPPLARGFVGRTTELAQLNRLLAEDGPQRGRSAVVAVVDGLAGVGKTAFALELAHRLRSRFPDGQLFVDLRGTSLQGKPLTAGDALAQLLSSLGVDDTRIPADPASRATLYRSLVHDRRMLVVLDDALSADQLRPLIPGGSSCVLATSRHRLSGLAVRDGAHLIDMTPLAEHDSVELLTYLGGDTLRREPAAVARLARMCGGLPLALRGAAEALVARCDVPLAALIERYTDEGALLDRLTVENDASASVRTVFEASYLALPAEAARMFRYLGLYSGSGSPITVQVAATLAGTSRTTTRRLLDLLVDNHLLEEETRDRYRFHDLIGLYAAECAEREPLANRELALSRLLRPEQVFGRSRTVALGEEDWAPHATAS